MVDGVLVEEDGRRWTLTLREGLRWHDGEPVLARDCVASIRRWAVYRAPSNIPSITPPHKGFQSARPRSCGGRNLLTERGP
jgi:ABC-type transport system substrate-binding protein